MNISVYTTCFFFFSNICDVKLFKLGPHQQTFIIASMYTRTQSNNLLLRFELLSLMVALEIMEITLILQILVYLLLVQKGKINPHA